MSNDSNTQHRATRQRSPTKIIVERHYTGNEKMETVFKRFQKRWQSLFSLPMPRQSL